jgi:hypothetical protein
MPSAPVCASAELRAEAGPPRGVALAQLTGQEYLPFGADLGRHKCGVGGAASTPVWGGQWQFIAQCPSKPVPVCGRRWEGSVGHLEEIPARPADVFYASTARVTACQIYAQYFPF